MIRTTASATTVACCLLAVACDSNPSAAPQGCMDGLVCYCVRARIVDGETLEALADVDATVRLDSDDQGGQGEPSDADGWAAPCVCEMFGGCGPVGQIDYDVPELPEPEQVEFVVYSYWEGCEQRFTIDLGPETMTVTDDSPYHYEIELTEPLAVEPCVKVALGSTGIFELTADGGPARAAFSVALPTEKPTDSPSGCSLFIDLEDVEVAGVEAPQALSTSVTVYVGPADSADPCDDGENAGSFAVVSDGTDVALEVSELALSGAALSRVISGRFTVCRVASGDTDATLTIHYLGIRFAHP